MSNCKAEDCTVGGYLWVGYCSKHYYRFKKYGTADPKGGFKPHTKHGMKNIPEYQVWVAMLGRCGRESNPSYKNYGGRGIKVCDSWKQFVNFIEDMGRRPGDEYTLERIDNDGNYEPSNCKWATRFEQTMNRRVTVMHEGKSVAEWAEKLNIKAHNLSRKVRLDGWDEAIYFYTYGRKSLPTKDIEKVLESKTYREKKS